MRTKELIREIHRRPINKRILVIEQILKSIREGELNNKMDTAVDVLMNDYIGLTRN